MKDKRKGFTLAEVLITLTIIGVVASLTIPTLINNIGDQQNKVAWRKTFADLSQTTMQIVAENGGSLIGAFSGEFAGSENLKNAYASRLNVVKNCSGSSGLGGSGSGSSIGGCWHNGNNSWHSLNGTGRGNAGEPGIILNNGAMMFFYIDKTDCSYSAGTYTRCGRIYIDTNGFKQPNTIGKDIFATSILYNTLIPYGAQGFLDPSTNCIEGSTAVGNEGWGCSAKYLYQ